MAVASEARQKKTFRDTLKSAHIGVREAQYEVGLMYANGVGVAQDLGQALMWIGKAAERGLASAQYLLATRYASGIGVDRNENEALAWFLKAAGQGHAKAHFKVARFYAVAHPDLFLRFLTQAAEQGVAEAQSALAGELLVGKITEHNLALAAHWYQQAADQGVASAQCALADMYASGLGVTLDIDAAMVWYRKAARQNFAAAQVAMDLLDERYPDRAVRHGLNPNKQRAAERRRTDVDWDRAAEQGDPSAKYHLGLMYEMGSCIDQNMEQAEAWYRVAAGQGHLLAQLALARWLETSYPAEAAPWYQRAAEQGDPQAQFALGRMYSAGQGVDQDFWTGHAMYVKAADQGDVRALMTLGNLLKGSLDHVATACFERAAQQGVAEAQFLLAEQYANGKGVVQDISKALGAYTRAAEQGFALAQCALGMAYLRGTGVAKNFRQAYDWFEKAAEQGQVEAQYRYGYALLKGLGVVQDYKRAFFWLEKAARNGYADAQLTLGEMYQLGLAVNSDNERAYLWFNLAAAQGVKAAASSRDLLVRQLSKDQIISLQTEAGIISRNQQSLAETQ